MGILCVTATVASSPSFAQTKQQPRPTANKVLKGWVPFSSKSGGFSALFPAKPKNIVRDEGVYKVHAFYHAVPGGAYMVTYSDMRESGISKERIKTYKPQDILDANRQGMVRGARGTLVSERRLSWQGSPAREIVYDIPQLQVRARCLLVFAGPFLYQVSAIVPKKQEKALAPKVRAFLDCFQFAPPPF